ncbi:phosphate transporter PHO1 homolog 10-like isoform X1 [Solanum pennellii]|uniref:Phosphate transporter PHO1 homolog 10-like isoform X1 n=1 Tax=Solanum pennellii TaxID=28526 RepID=A0ABM1VFW2_SOLPN|nr:phosphate transporter PHO1 homolog 10-like isoform X1 [Solanum pennellii]
MKFGKKLKDEMVPEWSEAYMDYGGLKHLLKDINHYNTHRKVDIENQGSETGKIQHKNSIKLSNGKLFIPAEMGQNEKSFFEKLDNELEKVDRFNKDKVEDAKGEAAELAKQMEALIALRKKVKERGTKGDKAASSKVTSPGRASSEAEEDQLDFKEEVDKFGEKIIKPASSSSENRDSSLGEHGRTPSDVLECVKIQNTSDSPKSSVERLLLGNTEKECSFSQEELKEVEEKLKKAFVEFYHKLRRLNQYSFMNLSAFSVILEKYEKITSRKVMRSYMKIVDNSYIGSSDEVTGLLNKVEATIVKHFNSGRGDDIRLVRPERKREKHSIWFLSGFYCGFSVALIMAIVLIIKTRKLLDKEEATVYLDSIYPLYSFYGYIILHMLIGAANIYLWRCYRINYSFILGFKPGTELDHKEVFLLASGLAVLVLTACLVQLHIRMDSRIQEHETFVELVPLGLLIGLVLICLCPFNIIYRSSRFFLIRSLFRSMCAPLYKVVVSTKLEFYTRRVYCFWLVLRVVSFLLQVNMIDFFLSDQLTSQTQAIRSFVYYICYYSWGKSSAGRKMCHVSDVYIVFYYISAAIPYWIRFFQVLNVHHDLYISLSVVYSVEELNVQCIRRLMEEKEMKHGFNGFTYFSMLLSVVFQSTFRLKKKMTWKVWALVSSGVAALANITWDIRMDWGLLQMKSRNFLLRDKLLLHHKTVYYIAMILEVLLRFVWLQVVLSFDMRPLRGKVITSTFASLEILRRGIWNFFRLENEHLNNVGEYRAFKSLPLPFITDEDKVGKNE